MDDGGRRAKEKFVPTAAQRMTHRNRESGNRAKRRLKKIQDGASAGPQQQPSTNLPTSRLLYLSVLQISGGCAFRVGLQENTTDCRLILASCVVASSSKKCCWPVFEEVVMSVTVKVTDSQIAHPSARCCDLWRSLVPVVSSSLSQSNQCRKESECDLQQRFSCTELELRRCKKKNHHLRFMHSIIEFFFTGDFSKLTDVVCFKVSKDQHFAADEPAKIAIHVPKI
jgi:hypothetical protein